MHYYDSGFLIVRPYQWLYRRFWKPAEPEQSIYAIPRRGADPNSNQKRYQGIDREALSAWYEEEFRALEEQMDLPHKYPEDRRAEEALAGLEDRGLADDDFIPDCLDALAVFSKLEHPDEWELIWVAKAHAQEAEPANARLLGFEPTWFYGDHFSAIADSMCFPRWHGPDPEGTLFLKYFSLLNGAGLFPSPSLANDFLGFYLSFDWTETGKYEIAKVMAVKRE